MKKIRVGNDITVEFSITVNGKPEDLSMATNLSVLVHPDKILSNLNIRINDIVGNKITFVIDGDSAIYPAVYWAYITYDMGEKDRAVDSIIFELVDHSCQQVDFEPPCVNVNADINIGESGIEEAPINGKQYGRQDGTWTETVEDAPKDDSIYGRINGNWQKTIIEAPSDEKVYGQKNGIWSEVIPKDNSGYIIIYNYKKEDNYEKTI